MPLKPNHPNRWKRWHQAEFDRACRSLIGICLIASCSLTWGRDGWPAPDAVRAQELKSGEVEKAGSTPPMLKGTVVHSDSLDPLPDRYRVGKVFDEKSDEPASIGKDGSESEPKPGSGSSPLLKAKVKPEPKPKPKSAGNGKAAGASKWNLPGSHALPERVPQNQAANGAVPISHSLKANVNSGKESKNSRPAPVNHSGYTLWQLANMSTGGKGRQFNLNGSKSSYSGGKASRSTPSVSPLRFKVPNWLAGKWQRTQATELERTELPSGKNLPPRGTGAARIVDVFGTYKDDKGQIWQTFSADHAAGQIDRGESVDHHVVRQYNLTITGPRTVLVEVRAYHFAVDKKQHRITKVYQDEELNNYTLLADGRVRTDSSVKVFDADGAPTFLTRACSDERRICRFDDLLKHSGNL